MKICADKPVEIMHFVWHDQGLLPAGYSLAFNRDLGTLSLLFCEEGIAHMQKEWHFPKSEQGILRLLLTAYPQRCSTESLEAVALQESNITLTTRYCYRLISRLRHGLQALGLDIVAVHETGYELKPFTGKKRARATPARAPDL